MPEHSLGFHSSSVKGDLWSLHLFFYLRNLMVSYIAFTSLTVSYQACPWLSPPEAPLDPSVGLRAWPGVEEAETCSHGPPNRKRMEEFQRNHRLVIGFDSHPSGTILLSEGLASVVFLTTSLQTAETWQL
ncbi:hypothetical protein OPV22_015847 [Ensete ventricosum]|uniref:Uncharacterized protein n=1 Tax=Ensete ventricosum TaxID=4639 RepID=A0AAV8RAE2_ENSVE|nr:hypothetical protein OPV22_015847 [Ensete ventricosum]